MRSCQVYLHLVPLIFIIYKFAPLIESIEFEFSAVRSMLLEEGGLGPLVLNVLVPCHRVVLLLWGYTLHSLCVILRSLLGGLRSFRHS